MNILDWIIIGILAIFTLYGYFCGFLRILIELGGIILAFYLSAKVSQLIRAPFPWGSIIYSLTFFIILTIFVLIAKSISKIGKWFPLNKFFSGFFGLISGITFSSFIISLIYKYFPQKLDLVNNSYLAKYIIYFVNKTKFLTLIKLGDKSNEKIISYIAFLSFNWWKFLFF